MKPFLKWIGGKSSLIDKVLSSFPESLNNYHEIFIGGGSVLLELLESKNITVRGSFYDYDINEGLVNTYKNLQSNTCELLLELKLLKNEYFASKSGEDYYYLQRKIFNELDDKSSVKYSALFIFLNKIGFRGMYRESKNGFNVPYGHYKAPEIYNEENMKKISELIKDVRFICIPFEESILKAEEGDFMYLDPPYLPISATSFVKYNNSGFSEKNHTKLFNLIKESKASFSLSNSDTPLIRLVFSKFKVLSFKAKRRINPKNPGSTVGEVIISRN